MVAYAGKCNSENYGAAEQGCSKVQRSPQGIHVAARQIRNPKSEIRNKFKNSMENVRNLTNWAYKKSDLRFVVKAARCVAVFITLRHKS
jgi:hypothetical protein